MKKPTVDPVPKPTSLRGLRVERSSKAPLAASKAGSQDKRGAPKTNQARGGLIRKTPQLPLEPTKVGRRGGVVRENTEEKPRPLEFKCKQVKNKLIYEQPSVCDARSKLYKL